MPTARGIKTRRHRPDDQPQHGKIHPPRVRHRTHHARRRWTCAHGAWVEVDEATGIDKAGADNYLGGGIPTGQGTIATTAAMSQVEKYDWADRLKPDYTWPQRIPIEGSITNG